MTASSPRRSIVFEHDPLSVRAMSRMAIGAGIVVVIGCIFGLLVANASPVPAEEEALQAVAERRIGPLTSFLGTVSWLGSLWLVALVTFLTLPLLRAVTRGWEAPWLVVLSLVGSLAVTAVVKVVVSRERPLDALTETTSAAFPSGHVSRTAAMLGLGVWVVLQISRHPAVRRTIAGVLIFGIGLMAFSRIYLGVHWPTDVLFGIGLGIWWLMTMLHAVGPRVTAAAVVDEDDAQITRP